MLAPLPSTDYKLIGNIYYKSLKIAEVYRLSSGSIEVYLPGDEIDRYVSPESFLSQLAFGHTFIKIQ